MDRQSGIDIESMKVQGGQLIDKIKELVEEGNVRRIVIKQEGRTVVEFPLTIGVVGVVLAPVLAAVGALAALLTECTIEVHRHDGGAGSSTGAPGAGGAAGSTGATGPANGAGPGANRTL